MKISSDETKLTVIGVIILFAVMPFDMLILQYMDSHTDCRPFYAFITDFALGKWYTAPSGIVFVLGLLLWKLKKLPAKLVPVWRGVTLFFFAVAGSGIIADILKRLVARARPVEYLQHHVTGVFHWHEAWVGDSSSHFSSFPSGHATTAFAVATAISFLLPQKYRALQIPVYVAACLLGFSRLVVEAHYASDVMAGVLVGCWGAVLAKRYLAEAKWFAAVN